MRTRTRITGGPITLPDWIKETTTHYCSGASDPVVKQVLPEGQSRYMSETMTDELTPGFFSMPKKDLPINNMVRTSVKTLEPALLQYDEYRTSNRPCTYPWRKNAWTYHAQRSLFLSHSADPSLSSMRTSLMENAANKALQKSSGITAELMQSAAEAKGTFEMIAYSFRNAVKKITAFRRSKTYAKMLKSASKSGADVWLEARYGWRPLLYEIDDLMEGLATGQKTKPFKCLGTEKDSTTIDSSFDMVLLRYPGEGLSTIGKTTTITLEARAGLTAFIDIHSAFRNKWGLRSWGSTAWEVIPFSVFVDIFINIGEMLSYLDYNNYTTTTKGWTSLKTTKVTKLTSSSNPFVSVASGGNLTTESYERFAGGLSFTPQFSMPNPLQWVDLGALGIQKLLAAKRR